MEYLGPDALNKDQQEQIQAVLANTATVHRGWTLIPNWLHVRCDDPRKWCSQEDDNDPCKDANFDDIDAEDDKKKVCFAYANNPKQSQDKYPEINFCKPFFDQRSLTNAIAFGSAFSSPVLKSDIRYYVSRGKLEDFSESFTIAEPRGLPTLSDSKTDKLISLHLPSRAVAPRLSR